MASIRSIDPFPTDIDRTTFGYWLSGFSDGEGCFTLESKPPTSNRHVRFKALFRIRLRADDLPILRLIHSYFGCGNIEYYPHVKATANSNPTCGYRTSACEDLIGVIIPHFDAFPLLAKKANDYAIWRQGVMLMHEVRQRKHRYVGTRRVSCYTAEERATFIHLVARLRQEHRYVDDREECHIPEMRVQPSLFNEEAAAAPSTNAPPSSQLSPR